MKKQFHSILDEIWMKDHPEFQMFSNFAFKGNTVFVTKNWILNHTDLDPDSFEDKKVYETTLSISGFHNVEKGIYGVEINHGNVVFGDTSKTFLILLNGDWKKARPVDHKGYYSYAKKLGY
jgi:hypothetical protein